MKRLAKDKVTPFWKSKPTIYLGRAWRESLHAQARHRAGDGLASGHRVNLLERYDYPLLPPALSRRVRLSTWVSERRAHRDATAQISAKLFAALELRDFDLAEQLLRTVRLDPLARAALRNAATNYGQPLGGSGDVKVRKRAGAGAAGEVSAKESADDANPGANTGSDKSSDKSSNNGSAPSPPRQWKPMSQECLALVKSAFPRRQMARHWLLDGSEIAAALRSATLPCSALSGLERSLLDETWSQPEKAALVMAGVHEVFSDKSAAWTQLPLEVIWELREKRKDITVLMAKRLRAGVDPQELLELLSRRPEPLLLQEIERHTGSRKAKGGFAASVINYAGTPAWHAAGGWNLHKREASLHLLWHAESGAPAVDPKAFTQAATEHLVGWAEDQPEPKKATPARATWARRSSSKATSDTAEPPTPTAVQAAAALCNANSGFLQLLVERASKPWLKELIPQLSRLSQLKYLQDKVPAEFRSLVLRARAIRTKDPKRLVMLLQDGARGGLEIPWSPAWKAFVDPYVPGEGQLSDGAQTGRDADTAALQVLALALRRNVKQLKVIASKVPDPLMRRALREAAFSLRGTPGKDPVLLELGAHVGLDHLPHLAAAMVSVEHGEAPGRRVDHCYHQWQLPKNSGGTRTISAPIPALKRAQRALLDNLLTPLGAHRCAYGFVKGRSIKDNAALHVGREIVVNADVSNCFPSVRWPLVLGALRRDFAGELSAGAIGTILDLCTAEGGLPIGAPTSPALLNRVLLKTDEILEASAQERGCLYSRYADDITFSGDHGAVKLLGVAKGVLGRIGLNLDPRKTNIFRRGRRQVCTGLVVNERVSVPRRVRRRLRAAVHRESIDGKSTWHGQPQSTTSLKGRLAFLGMVHPQEAAKLLGQLATPPEPAKKAQPKGRKSP